MRIREEVDLMEITASMVKELRECTGAGMMDCKAALGEAGGDMDRAVDILRTKGLADLAKKAGRATNEGLVETWVSADGKTGAVVEVNCETDFVARNSDFAEFVVKVAQQVGETGTTDIAALKTAAWSANASLSVEQAMGEMVSKLGENMGITRTGRMVASEPGMVGTYVHGVGRIGVLVGIDGAGADDAAVAAFAKDVAMHVAAASPLYARREEVPAAVLEHEMSIYKAQAAESGKPEQIQEKIAQGRLEKFYKEVCLVEQVFVKDPDLTIDKLTDKVSKEVGSQLAIAGFMRWALGETSGAQPEESC